MTRLLMLSLGPHFIPTELPLQEYYRWLSKEFEGEIVAVVSRKEYRRFALGNFQLVGLYLPKWIRERTLFRNLAYIAFVLTCVPFRHNCRQRYSAVICKEPLVTGVLAVLIGRVFGIKSIVEVNGNFESAFRVNSRQTSLIGGLKSRYAATVIPRVLGAADGVKLVFARQLDGMGVVVPQSKLFVFPNFVPITRFSPSDEDHRYLFFCGFPWHLKGVDILIQAFQRISPEFPEHRLKIVGYCPDKSLYQRLAAGNPRIELCDPVWYEGVKDLMEKCSLFILPSRTDSSPRVLREAMAAKKPIVASNVDGIPSLIKDGYNGLLFESENVDDLANKLRAVLRDPALAKTLAGNGLRHVHEALSEGEYVRQFSRMIAQVVPRHEH